MATAAYEENDDEGHYDRTQGMGAYSSAFLPEEHPIWRAQSVDHPYAGMKLVDISKMEIVRSFLFRNLPSSCKAFGLIQRLLRDAKESNAAVGNAGFVYVDDINDVNGVAVLHNADLKQKKKCNITCFVQSLPAKDTVDRICRLVDDLSFENVIMGGLESQLASEIGKSLPALMPCSSQPSSSSSYDISYSSCPYGCFVQESPITMEIPPPPIDYELGQLRVEDAAKINASWPYRSEGSEEMIRGMIRNTTCTGAYHKNVLVAWLLTYDDGALGMLLVEEAHRRKGLGKSMLHLHLLQWMQSGWGCNPYCYIAPDNDASMALFASMGFVRKHDASWEGFRLKIVTT